MNRGQRVRGTPAVWLAALLLGGCAQVGPVLAPSAGLPQPVSDFTAVRRGPEVALAWTAPTRTSDGEAYGPARRGGPQYRLCAWPGIVRGTAPPPAAAAGKNERQAVAQQIPSRLPNLPGAGGSFPIPSGALMPPCPHPIPLTGPQVPVRDLAVAGAMATLALGVANGDGAMAGWSNLVEVPLTAVAPPPRLQAVVNTAQGVRLQWQLPQPAPEAIIVYRSVSGGQLQLLARLPGTAAQYLDRTRVWGQSYEYWVRSAAGAGAREAESADSAHLPITPRDVFPPPVPAGLQGMPAPGGGGVDLSWNGVVADDLEGYNVYRRLAGETTWQKRNSTPLLTPVFHDSLPAQATGAEYAVTAVDHVGNESARSQPVRLP